MLIAVAENNPHIGNIAYNLELLLTSLRLAQARGADILFTSELALTGYPPRDLLLQPRFIQEVLAALQYLETQVGETAVVVGSIALAAEDSPLRGISTALSNAALVFYRGKLQAVHRKMLLPTYDVFDEARYFVPGKEPTLFKHLGVQIGLTICEDLWFDALPFYRQAGGLQSSPVARLAEAGADLLVNLSASPYTLSKPHERLAIVKRYVAAYQRPFLYINQVGGNDSLIFDGRSFAVNSEPEQSEQSEPLWHSPAFASRNTCTLLNLQERRLSPLGEVSELNDGPPSAESRQKFTERTSPYYATTSAEEILEALTLGLRDYLAKCNFQQVLLGLSGGIDSAVVAALAVYALGSKQVRVVALPSRYSSASSWADAQELAHSLGLSLEVLNIEPIFEAFLQVLQKPFAGYPEDLTEENLQARIRGTLLMAYANKFKALLLTTSNKSEIAVGYATLYGDTCGALAPLGDLYKTQVYQLARYLNQRLLEEGWASQAPINESILHKAPTAELRFKQVDQDSLPPYELLDALLYQHLEEEQDFAALVAQKFPSEVVNKVLQLVASSEYKRAQLPPVLKLSKRAFGVGRRMPIAAQLLESGVLRQRS